MSLLVVEAEVAAATPAAAAATMAGDTFRHLLSVLLKIILEVNFYDTEERFIAEENVLTSPKLGKSIPSVREISQ